MKKVIREYKQGRQKNFFLRENNGTYYLEKITKSCGFTVICGDEATVLKYIEDNNFKFVGLVTA